MAHVIDAVITLRDQLSGTLRSVNGNLSQFQRQARYAGANMVSVGKDMGAVGKTLSKTVTVPIVAAGAALLKLGKDFEDAYDTIRVGTGATGDTLKGLESDYKATLGQVGSSMGDVSETISDLNTRTGLAGKPLQDLSVQMLQLAKITKGDLGTLIPATTRMFQDAGIKQADYSKALDYTFKVSQNTGIGVDSLQQLMTQFGGPLRQMGFDWQTSAAMLGQFEKQGVNTELVVGSLRIALGKMAKEGIKDPSQALQSMITQIKGAGSAGQANALALSMFGAKAGPDMAAAIREGRMDLSGLLKTLKDSPETINKAAADTQTFSDKLAKTKNQLSVAFEPVATSLMDSLDKLLPSIQKVATIVSDFAKKLADMSPQQQQMILKFALMAAAAGPVFVMLSKVVGGIGGTIKTFTNLSHSIADAGGMMKYIASPGGIVILVIAAIAVAAFLLIKYWGPISTFFKNLWVDIKTIFNNIKDSVIGAWEAVKTGTVNIWNGIVNGVKNFITGLKTGIENIFNGIKSFFANVWTGIKNVVMNIITPFVKGITNIFDHMQGGLSTIFNGLKTFFTGVWSAIKLIFLGPILLIIDLFTGNFGRLKTDAIKIFNGLVTAFGQIWTGIKQIFKGYIQAIVGAAVGMFENAKRNFIAIWTSISNFLSGLWAGIKSIAVDAWNGIKTFFATFWKDEVQGWKNIINGLLDFFENLPGNFLKLVHNVGGSIINGFGDAVNFIKNLPAQALQWGKDMIQGLIDGITGAISGIGKAVSGVADKIRSFLHFSVPDQGPLRDYMSWMPDMLKGMSQGIKINTHLVTDKVKDIAVGIKANVQKGASKVSGSNGSNGSEGTGKGNIILNFNMYGGVRDDSDIEKIANALVLKLNGVVVNMP